MPRLCCVCAHPNAVELHAALTAHTVPVLQLAAAYSLSRDSLNFCRRRHLASPAAALPPAAPPTSPADRAIRTSKTRDRARDRFLEVYAQCGNVSTAARAAGIARNTVYVWAEHDDSFAQAMRAADIQATEALESEAWRRARDGFAEPVYQHGKLVGTVQRYSDALLVFLLKARAPERYRDRVDVSVTPVIKAVAGFDPADVV